MLDFSNKFDDPSLNLLDALASPGIKSPKAGLGGDNINQFFQNKGENTLA